MVYKADIKCIYQYIKDFEAKIHLCIRHKKDRYILIYYILNSMFYRFYLLTLTYICNVTSKGIKFEISIPESIYLSFFIPYTQMYFILMTTCKSGNMVQQ